jgi:hypothetical protein
VLSVRGWTEVDGQQRRARPSTATLDVYAVHVPLSEKTEALSWPLSPRSRRFALRSTLSTVHERLDYHQEGPELVPKITQVTTKLRWNSVSLSCIWHFTLNTKKAVDKGCNTFQSGDTPNQKQNEFANTHYLPSAEIQSNVISKKKSWELSFGSIQVYCLWFPLAGLSLNYWSLLWYIWEVTAYDLVARGLVWSQDPIVLHDKARPHTSGLVNGYWEIHAAPFLQSTHCAQWFATLRSIMQAICNRHWPEASCHLPHTRAWRLLYIVIQAVML